MKKKNPEHTKEVNECYYILLASICYIVTSEEIQLVESRENKRANSIEIDYYCSKLEEIYKTLENLNNDLYIYLKEMYIIDELIMIIKLFKKNNNIDIDKINDIKNYLRENAFIIKINANNKDSFELNEELIENFKSIYNLIDNDENINKNDIYYDTLKYIFFKEVKKISEVNYHYIILENLLKNEVIIKKSNDIFQIIFKNYFKQEKFKNIIENIFKGEEVTLKLLEKKLNGENAINLREMLLYFLEKNSLKYFQNVLNQKEIINLDDEPLKILGYIFN